MKPRGNHEAGASRGFSCVPVSRPAFGLTGADEVAPALGFAVADGAVADGDVDEHAAASRVSTTAAMGMETRMRSPTRNPLQVGATRRSLPYFRMRRDLERHVRLMFLKFRIISM